MIKRSSIIVGLLLLLTVTNSVEAQDKPAKPYTIGLLPAIDYSADRGFGYGVLFQFDDKRSSEYTPYYASHRIVLQQTTRGIQNYEYRLDTKYMLPVRMTLKLRYNVSLFEPYHGMGGAMTWYDEALTDTSLDSYVYKHYYTYDKRFSEISANFQGNLPIGNMRWLAGVSFLNTTVAPINPSDHDAPYTDGNPYDIFINNTLLEKDNYLYGRDMEGGREHSISVGVVYDTRDHESSPTSGIWSEALFRTVPSFLGSDYEYSVFTAMHRQYFPFGDKLSLAVRGAGRLIFGDAPFFSMSRIDGSFNTEFGLGGGKTIRGILWQRILADSFVFTNIEIRYRFMPILKDGYLAVSAFYDGGMSFDDQEQTKPGLSFESVLAQYNEIWHAGYGGGLRIALNSTFIVAVDAGFPVTPAVDGAGMKLYIGLDWLF